MSINLKIKNLVELYDLLPENERIIVDILRDIISAHIPDIKEKISYNVPFFYRNKSLCLVWPTSIPRGGIKKGVLLGFWYGHLLEDIDQYLTHGTNKQIFYKIYQSPEEIDEEAVAKLLRAAVNLDNTKRS